MFNEIVIKAKVAVDNFVNDQRGVTAIEYAIIGVAMSAIVLGAFAMTGADSIGGAMTTAVGKIADAMGVTKTN